MATIVPPDERACERCGRHDVWDDDAATWRIAEDDDGEKEFGSPFCLHEWNINGEYSPIAE